LVGLDSGLRRNDESCDPMKQLNVFPLLMMLIVIAAIIYWIR
jgi:hypothetical protein